MRIGKSLFATPLLFLFVAFLYSQPSQADCPDDWWCSDTQTEVVSTPQDPFSYSPGFDLLICFDQTCANNLGPAASTLPAPNVTITTDIGCVDGTEATLSGPAICAAANDGVVDPDSVAACNVAIILPGVTCSTESGGEVYESSQAAKQDPNEVFAPGSEVLVKGVGLTGWPCPTKDLDGKCTTPFSFPIGTEYCSSFNGCVAKIYPETGDGSNFKDLKAGQVLKGVEEESYLTLRGCKGQAAITVDRTTITCIDSGKALTGGGEASVGVICPEGNWAGNRDDISPNSSNNGFDIFGDSDCIVANIVPSSVKLNGVPNQGFQLQQQDNRFRFFFDEAAVYAASCSGSGDTAQLVATGSINVPQGTETVAVPFYTNPANQVICK
jgi:hypothetical protein